MADNAPKVNRKVRPDDQRGTPPGAGTHVPPQGGAIGNPPYEPTDEDRANVVEYVRNGLTQADIADLLGIHRTTFNKYFYREWRIERIKIKLEIATRLTKMALDGDKTCMIFWLRTQAKWNVRIEHTGADGGAIKLIDLTQHLAQMEEAQLDALEPLLADILAQGGAGLGGGDPFGLGTGAGGESEEEA